MADVATATTTFELTSSPHVRAEDSVSTLMWRVNLALLPAGLAALYFYGPWVLWVVGLSVGTCMLAEAAALRLRGRAITLSDGSAVVAGLLLAYNLPPHAPWYLPVAGGLVTMLIAKHAFGGLGQNIFNPALAEGVSYAILLMNCCVPLIDRYLKPRPFGTRQGTARRASEKGGPA